MTSHLPVVDCHVHVFLPECFSFSARRSYTPGPATTADLVAHLDRIGAHRVLVVQPSPYGTDNRATLAAIAKLGLDRARGVAVVDPRQVTSDDIRTLRAQGVVACRANLKTRGTTDIEDCAAYLRALDSVLLGTDMAIEIYLPLPTLLRLRPVLAATPRVFILDHFAGLDTTSANLDAEIDALCDLLSLPNVILKASGACRATGYSATNDPLDPIAPLLFRAAPGRVIWGSDWPHTGRSAERAFRPLSEVEPFMSIDDMRALADLQRWAGSSEHAQAILAETPAQLFGF
ncbi:amidohydrolase family protein [Paracoccus rhizosphaerae]|uniref:Amidohydrolase family protein n=1 Tax=Paracoccus rhizosphaerae TaxID=1133347 RepID=A0ABV6CGC2_9RHOB|nr:amidohydrolase family protein [Paracoccus rhizosphaerae]